MYTLYLTFIAINFPSDPIESAYACATVMARAPDAPSGGNELAKDSVADYIIEICLIGN